MSYLDFRSEDADHDKIVTEMENNLLNANITEGDIYRLFRAMIEKAQSSSTQNFRLDNVAPGIVADLYSNQLTATERTTFQTITGLS